MTGTANGATATVAVPAGSLPSGAEVVLSAGVPSTINAGNGSTVEADFSVVLLDSTTGEKLTGPFSPGITITIQSSSIKAGDTVVFVTGSGQSTAVSGAQVTAGQAVVTFTSDPNIAVLAGSPTTVPGATGATTGKPFMAEGLVAGALVLAGASGLGIVLRRRRSVG